MIMSGTAAAGRDPPKSQSMQRKRLEEPRDLIVVTLRFVFQYEYRRINRYATSACRDSVLWNVLLEIGWMR